MICCLVRFIAGHFPQPAALRRPEAGRGVHEYKSQCLCLKVKDFTIDLAAFRSDFEVELKCGTLFNRLLLLNAPLQRK